MFHDLLSVQNRALVLRFYKAFDDRRLNEGLSLLAPELVAHMAGQNAPLTRAGFTQLGTEVFNAFPDGRRVFEMAIAHKDMVTTSGYFTGTHLDTFKGIPATGKTVKYAIMHIDRVHHSKIVEHWGQSDSLSMVQQLGVKLVPGPGLVIKMGVEAGRHFTGDTFERLRAVTQPDYYPQIPEYQD